MLLFGIISYSIPRRSACFFASIPADGADGAVDVVCDADALTPALALSRSAFTIRPRGPVPLTDVRSMPLSAAILRASGVAKIRSPEFDCGASGVRSIAGAFSTLGVSFFVSTGFWSSFDFFDDRFSSADLSSPSSSKIAIGVLTFTASVPSETRILPRTPSSTASTSIVALSVSISAITSPASTVSPSDFNHLASLPSSIVGDSAGIVISIDMILKSSNS